MRDKGGVVGVADYDAGDAFSAAIGVDDVGWRTDLALPCNVSGVSGRDGRTFLLHVLSLAWSC